MSQPVAEGIGDNKEVGLAVIQDYSFQFNDSTKSAADDTETTKYLNHPMRVKDYAIRSDQTCQIISINGITLTDPISIMINKAHIEKLDVPVIFQMVIRTQTVNTNFKIRVRGILIAEYS